MTFEVINGYFGYQQGNEILQNIEFRVSDGMVMAILGPNGAGKTTLLKCMMGLLTWKQGESRIDGQNIAKLPMRHLWQKIAYVPQARGNALMYTAEEMVLLGRSAHVGMLQQPRQEDVEAARQAMDLVGATSLRHKLCSRMSGGELQMILIARALATRPSMLVLDEPESNLDFKNQLVILETIQRLAREQQISCIFNTHYPDHALRVSDVALLLYRSGQYVFGKAEDVISCENMETSFEVKVCIDHRQVGENCVTSVVPIKIL